MLFQVVRYVALIVREKGNLSWVGAQGLVFYPQAVNQVSLEPEHAAGTQTLLLGAGQTFSFQFSSVQSLSHVRLFAIP